MGNCPNCGAPIKSPVCEYCDTRFTNPTDYISSAASGIMTVNEMRESLGLKRLADERYTLEMELLTAKTRALASKIEMQRLYSDALNAMRRYVQEV